jgi:transposase
MNSMAYHLDEISKTVPENKHAVIVLDRAAWHTTKKLQIPDNIFILPLPPTSPELNPMENVWQVLKQRYLYNRCFDDYEHIVDACCETWNDWAKNLDEIKSLCSRTWINLKN